MRELTLRQLREVHFARSYKIHHQLEMTDQRTCRSSRRSLARCPQLGSITVKIGSWYSHRKHPMAVLISPLPKGSKGAPSVSLVRRARRSRFASSISANFKSKFWRSLPFIFRHGDAGEKAAFAATTASFTSSTPATGMQSLTSSPVAGLKIEMLAKG